ncbi:MAG: hypothetical protein KDN19_14055, partial [Verrucomicrobiae bacterium]|nr:hypothetical protein [Verrucomicrobiae bacterium]
GAACLLTAQTELFAQSQLRSRLMERARESRESSSTATDALKEVMEDENAAGMVNAVKSSVGEELDSQSTEDLIRAAQKRIQQSRESSPAPTTITDTTQPAQTQTQAPATQAKPAGQAMIPEPVASARPTATPTTNTGGGQLLTQADPAPNTATPPPVLTTPANIPPPVPLEPRYEKEKGASGEVMQISSDETVMNNEQHLITFTGQVIVVNPNPNFKMTSDRLDVWMNEEDSATESAPKPEGQSGGSPSFKKAIATGGMVEIEKLDANGKVQVAKARKAEYDAITEDIILTGGPPTLQSESGFVNPKSPDAVIILRKDGNHEIQGGSGRSTIEIPLPKKGSGSATPSIGGGLPTGNLDSLTNRRTN